MCNHRCWYAKGKTCKCECGGKNHGQGMKGEEMVRVEKTFPPCTPVRFKYSTNFQLIHLLDNHPVTVQLRGRSLGETFLFKGQVHIGVRRDGINFFLPPDELEKEYEEIDREEIPF